ncbi:MAG: hypothetical protein ACK4UK_05985 [Flavobacterium sp.]
MNKTLCSQKFNRDNKGNKMPIELSNYEMIKPSFHIGKKKQIICQEKLKF